MKKGLDLCFFHSKEQNEKKKIPVKYEKRFANNAVDKRLITKVHKQLIQLNFRKQTNKKTESKNKQKA